MPLSFKCERSPSLWRSNVIYCCFQVDLKKVNMDVIKKWITEQVTDLLQVEDEVTTMIIINSLEQECDPKRLQVMVTEFLGKRKAGVFIEELWTLLTDAQANPAGIPTTFIEKKKQEMQARQDLMEQQRAAVVAAQQFGVSWGPAMPAIPGRHPCGQYIVIFTL